MKVKICGITRMEDALVAVDAGADLLGLNFYKPSPRSISIDRARDICVNLRQELGDDCPTLVGLFVNMAMGDISIITEKIGLDFVQLSGDETENVLLELRGMGFKAIRPMNMAMALDDVQYFKATMPTDDRVPSLILDAYHPKLYGGTGEEASVDVAKAVKHRVPRMMLAGGLNPENVAQRIDEIHPWGVDVASGVESGEAGIKDAVKIRDFVQAAKGA